MMSYISLLHLLHYFDFFFFFFNDTATTEIYTLSLHDALPIYNFDELTALGRERVAGKIVLYNARYDKQMAGQGNRSEEHTSELQSHSDLVCRLLLEKKKNIRRMLISVHARLPSCDLHLITPV